jgi:hypothetical protein
MNFNKIKMKMRPSSLIISLLVFVLFLPLAQLNNLFNNYTNFFQQKNVTSTNELCLLTGSKLVLYSCPSKWKSYVLEAESLLAGSYQVGYSQAWTFHRVNSFQLSKIMSVNFDNDHMAIYSRNLQLISIIRNDSIIVDQVAITYDAGPSNTNSTTTYSITPFVITNNSLSDLATTSYVDIDFDGNAFIIY